MASPISLGDAIAIVDKALALYRKIREDVPEQIETVGRRMKRLRGFLGDLQDLLNDRSRGGLSTLRPNQIQKLKDIRNDIEEDGEKVRLILYKWDNQIGPFGFTLRFKSVAQALFAVSSNPDDLQKLSENIKTHCDDIHQQLTLLSSFGINALMIGGGGGSISTTRISPPPPLPTPLRNDYGIIFIDANNVGRSRAAEAYGKLVREWTVRTNNIWRIKFIHSAGLLLKHKSDTVAIQSALRMTMQGGNAPPNPVAMDALFDNKLFNYPYKAEIRKNALASRSRGLTQKLFSTYDFIFVFNRIDHANLLRLREALVNTNGPSAAPKGKGKVILLGSYGKTGVAEIWNPKKPDSPESRAGWNGVVWNIKVSFKAFLHKELKWIEPASTK